MDTAAAWEARGAWTCGGTARLIWNNGAHGAAVTSFAASAGAWHMRMYESGAFLTWLGRGRAGTDLSGQKCAIRIVPSDGFLTIGSNDCSHNGFTHTVVVGEEGAIVRRWGSGSGAEAILVMPAR